LRFALANGIPTYGSQAVESRVKTTGLQRVGMAFLALLALSPLGLLAQGEAWGEWDAKGVAERAGYTPQAVARQEGSGWKGFIADYGADRGPMFYVLSGLIGVVVLGGAMWAVGKGLSKKDGPPAADEPPSGPPAGGGGELPDWLSGSGNARPLPDGKRKSAGGFIEKSIAGIASGAQTVVFGEEYARRAGLLQRLDPRAKVLALATLIVVAGWAHSWAGLGLLFAVSLALAVLSSLPPAAFLKRVWLTVPLVIGVVALPATLNVVTKGEALFALWPGSSLSVTREGLDVAGLLALRVGVALSFAVLLTLTTRWNELLRALRALLVPKVFVIVLSMTYRYIELLLRSAAEMLTARRSRTVGPVTHREGRRYVGGAFAALFGRSVRLADDVHAAMTSRGFTGEIRTADLWRIGVRDVAVSAVLVLVAALAVVLGKAA
jgi:cobalt ECF transporter T component CbiQ